MKIGIVGTGYVGLVTGTCFAEVGLDVTCIDIDQKKIDNLNKGILPIYEPGLEELVVKNYQKKRLQFSTDLKSTIKDTDVIFIAVGTPPGQDGSADLKYVLQVASQIGQSIEHYQVVVTKSTVPVHTSEKVKAAIQAELVKRNRTDIPFSVASNPEFLKEGAAVDDFMKPDRIVIGLEEARAEEVMRKLYKPFVLNGHPVLVMDIKSAEMTKYAANAMLATKISFMNDIANLCEILGADINHVRKGIGSDPRIGNKFIYAGIGYGGSCFPKDVKALIKTGNTSGHTMRILQAVEDVNEHQKTVLANKIKKHFGDLKGKKFALWGLSFKPKTDDMREAPSLVIIDFLLKEGASVSAYDPIAMHEAKHMIGDSISYVEDMYDAIQDADALLLITEWPEFRNPDFDKIGSLLKQKVIFDGRNIFDGKELIQKGFVYQGIGVNP
ncbi:MAG: UDP-glucose/GDP-mannose dehydrogenase family protein [Cytophagaceae bacterium]|nr:UDP-glucose/GDP-mannose dehydrogenase family protein [Cytophagaceae bacterium]